MTQIRLWKALEKPFRRRRESAFLWRSATLASAFQLTEKLVPRRWVVSCVRRRGRKVPPFE